MPLYLVDRTMQGEPVGIWNDQGQSSYIPGQEDEQSAAQRTVQAKGQSIPWSEWVDNLSSSVNFSRIWGDIDTPELDMSKVLSQLRDRQTAINNQNVPIDRD